MGRKTFISYKYSEAQGLRDKILEALGKGANYYQGETSDSPDLTDTSTDNIKNNLKDMIHGTSVTIVVISPEYTKSDWIDWEIEYSLKEISREDKTSRTNGVVGVIMEVDGGYDWLIGEESYNDGCTSRTIENSKLSGVIKNNRYNLESKEYKCDQCKTVDVLEGSYISLILQKDFLAKPSKYIENAYEKSSNIKKYEIKKNNK